jgi:hypothetical protein
MNGGCEMKRIGFNEEIYGLQVYILRAVVAGDRGYGLKRAELFIL